MFEMHKYFIGCAIIAL